MGLRIALLQLLPESTLSGQLEKGKAACKQANEMGADIALFPEMWSDGYALPQDHLELEALSIDDSETDRSGEPTCVGFYSHITLWKS